MEKQYKADEFRRYTKAQLRQHLEELEAHVDTSPKLPKDHFVQACMEQSKVEVVCAMIIRRKSA